MLRETVRSIANPEETPSEPEEGFLSFCLLYSLPLSLVRTTFSSFVIPLCASISPKIKNPPTSLCSIDRSMDGSTSRTESRHSRTINLYCPSLSKLSTIVVPRDDNRIDIGAIARIFGLDPATVKLNGHFISRGVDLIASSITWKSLLSFFSARRLPTGVESSESGGFYSQSSSPFAAALRVDGKKSRPKRSHDGAEIGIDNQYHHRQLDDNGVDYSQSGDYIMSKKKQRVREIEAECERDGSRGSIYREEEDGVVGLKRRQEQLESNSCSSPLKRLKGKGDAFSQMFSWSINCKNGCRGKENTAELLEGAKRAREDDEVTLALGSSCKRVQRRPWAQQLPAR